MNARPSIADRLIQNNVAGPQARHEASAPLRLPTWWAARSVSIEELCQAFLDEQHARRRSPATVRYYRQAFARWQRFSSAALLTDPREVSPDHLTAFANALESSGLAPHSVATWMRAVRALMNWAEQRWYVEISPFQRWRLDEPKLPAQRGFTPDEVRAMIDAVGAQPLQALRDTAILLLLFDTGMRRMELAGLTLEDVVDGAQLRSTIVVHGKGAKERYLELHPQTQRSLYDYLTIERPKTRARSVFLGRANGRAFGWHGLTAEGVTEAVTRAARLAGIFARDVDGQRIRKLGPHALRHGFAKVYLEGDGARLDDLQVLLGHETLSMSQHYAKQLGAQARRGTRDYSPVNQLGLQLGRRPNLGRPKGSVKQLDASTTKKPPPKT